MTKREKRKLRPSSYFLGCFGFSRKIYSKEDGGEKKKKRSRWFLRLEKGEIKPSVIEETKKPILKVQDESDKQKTLPVISCLIDRKNIPVDDKSMIMETKETKLKEVGDIFPNRAKTMEPNGSFKKDTCPGRLSNSTRYGQPLKPTQTKNESRVDKLDPILGILIIILTLTIMLVWGRVCAILCTSAWCYLLPRLKNAANRKRNRDNGLVYVSDLNSESYKRKVVLDGFLGRQNRVS